MVLLALVGMPGSPMDTRWRTAGPVFTIGSELIEKQRMGETAGGPIDAAHTIFTAREIRTCESKRRKLEHYAARHAAKRAALKALGAAGRGDLVLREVEVINDERGKPALLLHGRTRELFEQQRMQQAALTLAHCRDAALAVVIMLD